MLAIRKNPEEIGLTFEFIVKSEGKKKKSHLVTSKLNKFILKTTG